MPQLVFSGLKQAISMTQVLEHYGLLEKLHQSRDSLNGPCPLHQGHNPSQFRVSISKNCWVCFGDCQAGGSILDFVARKEGISIREAALLLSQWFPGPAQVQPARLIMKPEPARSFNPPLGFQLPSLQSGHPYLAVRGLNLETIRAFELGLCRKGIMAGRIAIPIHDAKGQVVAYAGRWPGTPPAGVPKYRLPRGFRKSLELFNVHRALRADSSQPLLVVEGFFGCMALWQAGFRRVVALMGSTLSETQVRLIVEATGDRGKVFLLFDEDNAGRAGREKARLQLQHSVSVAAIPLPDEGLQPDVLSKETLRALFL